MKNYITLPADKAYKLLNNGAIIMVATRDAQKQPNLTPIAWHCPVDYEPVTRLLFVCDKKHKCFINILLAKKFVIVLPHASQSQLVKDMGSVSGHKADKLKKFKTKTFPSAKYKYSIPEGCIGYIECKLEKIVSEKYVGIVFGRAVSAGVARTAFKDRLLVNKAAGKTLHYLGSKLFYQPGDKLIT